MRSLCLNLAVLAVPAAAVAERLAQLLLAAVVVPEHRQQHLQLQAELAVLPELVAVRRAAILHLLLRILPPMLEMVLLHARKPQLEAVAVAVVGLVEVRCRARTWCPTRRHYTALRNTASIKSSSFLRHMAQ